MSSENRTKSHQCRCFILKIGKRVLLLKFELKYIEDITRWREDMNFIFEWQNYFTNECSEWVKYCFCHEKIKFISSSHRVMFFSLYRHADDGVFDDFPKISEDFPKLFRIPDERSQTFSENFWKFLKISEDFRGRPEDVSMIHQLILVQCKRQTWCHWTIDKLMCDIMENKPLWSRM